MSLTRRSVIGRGTHVYSVATFSTTDETVEASTKGLQKVVVLAITPLAAAGVNDVLAVAETSDADGVINVPTTGTITIDRPASGTSGLKIGVEMVGY